MERSSTGFRPGVREHESVRESRQVTWSSRHGVGGLAIVVAAMVRGEANIPFRRILGVAGSRPRQVLARAGSRRG
jgi:hypothetical protein